MGGVTRIAVVAVRVTCPATASAREAVTLNADCSDEAACVRMTLSSALSPSVEQGQDSVGVTTFSVLVRGSLDGSPVAERQVLIRGYTGGIECSAFGQATVAVVGHSTTGFATILTDHGALQLADTTLRVGCPDCAAIRQTTTGRLIGRRRSPGWDLALVGLHPDSLFVTNEGELAVRRGEWTVVMPASGPFRLVAMTRASSLYELELTSGACT